MARFVVAAQDRRGGHLELGGNLPVWVSRDRGTGDRDFSGFRALVVVVGSDYLQLRVRLQGARIVPGRGKR